MRYCTRLDLAFLATFPFIFLGLGSSFCVFCRTLEIIHPTLAPTSCFISSLQGCHSHTRYYRHIDSTLILQFCNAAREARVYGQRFSENKKKIYLFLSMRNPNIETKAVKYLHFIMASDRQRTWFVQLPHRRHKSWDGFSPIGILQASFRMGQMFWKCAKIVTRFIRKTSKYENFQLLILTGSITL